MKKYTVWVSNADSLADVLEVGQDLLRYDGLTWDDAMKLQKMSLEQGYTFIICQGFLEGMGG